MKSNNGGYWLRFTSKPKAFRHENDLRKLEFVLKERRYWSETEGKVAKAGEKSHFKELTVWTYTRSPWWCWFQTTQYLAKCLANEGVQVLHTFRFFLHCFYPWFSVFRAFFFSLKGFALFCIPLLVPLSFRSFSLLKSFS